MSDTPPPTPATWADNLRAVLLAPWLRWPYVIVLLAFGGWCLHAAGARPAEIAGPTRLCGLGFVALGLLAAASRNLAVHLFVHVAAGVLLAAALLLALWPLLQSLGLAGPHA